MMTRTGRDRDVTQLLKRAPMAGLSGHAVKTWVCGRLPAEIMDSNPAGESRTIQGLKYT